MWRGLPGVAFKHPINQSDSASKFWSVNYSVHLTRPGVFKCVCFRSGGGLGPTRDTITIYYIQEWSVRDHKERVELIYSPYVLLGGNLAHSAFWNVTPDIVLASFDLDGANFQRTTH